jgi:hypothetical protein
MVSSNNPARVPEPRPEPSESSSPTRPGWPREKRATRFVIKISGAIPT